MKFLSVSFDILAPTLMYNKWDRHIGTVLYYDGSVEYFGADHLPYAVLAITVLLVFTVLPILLLCLYPCRWFQKFLNSCHLRSQALHTFMDTFQGCYKDGTNGTRDCRYFAAIYLIVRVAVHLSLVIASVDNNSSLIALLVIVVLLLSAFHPYKKQLSNQLDTFLLGSMIVAMSTVWFLQAYNTGRETMTEKVLYALLTPIPLVYSLCLVLYCIWRRSRRVRSAIKRLRAFFSRPKSYQQLEQSLPRRVMMDEASALLRRDKP